MTDDLAPISELTQRQLLETKVAALEREAERATARLHSIHENGLCDNWLTECGERHAPFERFVELVDEQVGMDADERTPEFQERLRQAIDETEGLRRDRDACTWTDSEGDGGAASRVCGLRPR